MVTKLATFCLANSGVSRLIQVSRGSVLLCLREERLNFQKRTLITLKSAKSTEKLRKADGIPPGYDIVYHSNLDNYVSYGQVIGLSLGATMTYCIGYTLLTSDIIDLSASNENFFTLTSGYQIIFTIFCMYSTVVSIQLLSRKCPLRIYGKDKNYISVFNGFFGPFNRIKVEHVAGEIKKAERRLVPSLWESARYTLKNREVLLVESGFRSNADFNSIIS